MKKTHLRALSALGLLSLPFAISANKYGLASNCQDGVILHCFNWSFDNIREYLPEIAAAGYTSVQTSPAQQPKDYMAGNSGIGTPGGQSGSGQWWKLYQPLNFSIAESGQSWLGDAEGLKALCTEADKYGIKVIVDVVANHMAGTSSSDHVPNAKCMWPTLDEHYHGNKKYIPNYNTRPSITEYDLNGPDLNTENAEVQEAVKGYLKLLIDCGVDGFRFDAAKHIATPDDPNPSDFWPNVLDYARSLNPDVYFYGEILDGITSSSTVSPLRYTKHMSITDNRLGNTHATSLSKGNIPASSQTPAHKGIEPSKFVLWAESHDTYMSGGTNNYPVDVINRTWALMGGRTGYSALYLARTKARGGKMGEVGSFDWKAPEVVAVNKFHNATIGQDDDMDRAELPEKVNNRPQYVKRVLKKDGAIIVSPTLNPTEDRQIEIDNTGSRVTPGTYTELISGNKFTVTPEKISGKIGTTGIAVFYASSSAGIEDIISTPAKLPVTINGRNISVNGNCDVTLFNMQGISVGHSSDGVVEAPAAGTYIVVSGNNALKVFVR